jgi:hypothetical protein
MPLQLFLDFPLLPGPGLLASACRGDYKKLPSELLDLCEVEPLRQEEPESTRQVQKGIARAWRLAGRLFMHCFLLPPLPLRRRQQHSPLSTVPLQSASFSDSHPVTALQVDSR